MSRIDKRAGSDDDCLEVREAATEFGQPVRAEHE